METWRIQVYLQRNIKDPGFISVKTWRIQGSFWWKHKGFKVHFHGNIKDSRFISMETWRIHSSFSWKHDGFKVHFHENMKDSRFISIKTCGIQVYFHGNMKGMVQGSFPWKHVLHSYACLWPLLYKEVKSWNYLSPAERAPQSPAAGRPEEKKPICR